ncbi:MAG: tRNA (adenosine(37)-N6)-dimethylallyltransferase MiaA [Kiritimatiellae bacterium]|nr:tRNA (adenosine(37)-N6)-dimethylallyltransferase MiaA [Kiritimatiellia bacterium]
MKMDDSSMMSHNAWILAGATATGKSAVCQLLAEKLKLSILSADSMLVYKGMDIGTAKPTAEERESVSYSGIDLATPDQPFSTGAWIQAARTTLSSSAPAAPLIVTGGTGLYIKALTSGIDAEAVCQERRNFWNTFLNDNGLTALQNEVIKRAGHLEVKRIDLCNPRRIIRALEHLDAAGKLPESWSKEENKPSILALTMPREQLHTRIRQRITQMFSQGLLDEVRALKELYPEWSSTASKAIGYKEALAVLSGKLSETEAKECITIRTRQLAKRQETWFRHQLKTIWCEIEATDCIEDVADKVLCLWNKYGTTELKI